jgi:hypothetical protein
MPPVPTGTLVLAVVPPVAEAPPAASTPPLAAVPPEPPEPPLAICECPPEPDTVMPRSLVHAYPEKSMLAIRAGSAFAKIDLIAYLVG